MATGTYHGRLVCDGYGNLLADEGEDAGLPVAAAEDGTYVFVQPGEPSHNERHEKNTVGMFSTQDEDPDQPGYAGTKKEPVEGAGHHWDPLDSDPHLHGLRFDPDRVAVTITGHTEAYKNG